MIIHDDRGRLRISGALRHQKALSLMPGRCGWKDDQFFAERSRANIEFIADRFPEATWESSARDEIAKTVEVERELRANVLPPVGDHCFKTAPFNHQLEAFLTSREAPYYGFFMEMGTGKTKVLIDTAAWLWHHEKIDAMILVAPNGVHSQFISEQVPVHMPEDVDWTAFIYKSGGDKAFQARKAAFLKPAMSRLRILAINVESLSVASGMDYVISFLRSVGGPGKNKPVLMAVDESTRIKNHNSGRTKSITKLGTYCAYRRILTGSPVTKGVQDLFGQLNFLSPDILGHRSFYSFRNRYCVMVKNENYGSGKSYESIEGYQNLDELRAKMAPWVYRVRKDQCLDLPPKVYVRRDVPLSKQQATLYNELREELLIEFEGSTIAAPMAAVRMTKLQQILCGHLRFTDEGRIQYLDNVPRFEVTRDLVEEADDQIIIWARFTPDIDKLCEILGDCGVSRYDGRVKESDRSRMIADFRSGKNKVFVGQPASAGLGLNLVGPSTVIYYSNSFDAEHRWQSEDRNHRAGTTKSVTYYDLIVPNSIDSHILSVLRRKEDVAGQSIENLRNMLKSNLEA